MCEAFAVPGDGGRRSGAQSVKRHRIGRGQYVQAGLLARNMISLLLTTDDVVKIRAAACRENVGDRYGLIGDTFLLDVLNGTVREKMAL